MQTFNKPKTENKPIVIKKKSHWKLWLIFGIFLMTLIAMAGYGVKSFFDKYYFISPVQSKDVKVIKITPAPTKAPKKPITVHITEPVYAKEPSKPIVWDSEVKQIVMSYFTQDEQEALDELLFRESTWNPQAMNASSGACGLFQALPCEKMGCVLIDIDCQAKWGSNYIHARYGDANQALAFHDLNNWY